MYCGTCTKVITKRRQLEGGIPLYSASQWALDLSAALTAKKRIVIGSESSLAPSPSSEGAIRRPRTQDPRPSAQDLTPTASCSFDWPRRMESRVLALALGQKLCEVVKFQRLTFIRPSHFSLRLHALLFYFFRRLNEPKAGRVAKLLSAKTKISHEILCARD